MESLIIIAFLMLLIGFIMLTHAKERSELLNRLMATDLPEYVTHEVELRKARVPEKVVRQEGIPL